MGRWAVAPADALTTDGCDAHGPVLWDDDPLDATAEGRSDEGSEILRVLDTVKNEKESLSSLSPPPAKDVIHVRVGSVLDEGDHVLMKSSFGPNRSRFSLVVNVTPDLSFSGEIDDGLKRRGRRLCPDKKFLETECAMISKPL